MKMPRRCPSILVALLCSPLSLLAQVAGTIDAGFDPNARPVLNATVQPDGKIVMGGGFGILGGVARSRTARVNADGTLDTAFNPNIGGAFEWCTVVLPDGKIVIGGEFTTVGGVARNYIAGLNANGTLDTAFNPNANATVKCMAVQSDGKIVIGGDFTSVGGTTRNRIARLNANGTLDTAFNPNASGLVNSVIVQPDGKIILGGGFATVGGVARDGLARVNADGTVDTGFNPPAGSGLFCAALQADGKVLIGGLYTVPNIGTRYGIKRLNANGSLDTSFTPNVNDIVYSIALQADGKIVIGGTFGVVAGLQRYRVARLNPNGTLDAPFDPNAGNDVYCTALQADGKVLIGGDFSTVGGVARNGVARLLNDAATQNLSVENTSRVQWLRGGTAPETHLVTFEFSTNGGVSWTSLGVGTRIAGGWERTGLSLPANGSIRARARTAGSYVNGSSGLVEQTADFSLAVGNVDAGFNTSVATFPHGLAVQPDGKMAIANHPGAAFPEPCYRVKMDGTLDLVFSPSANDVGMCGAIQADGKVVFGGEFTTPGVRLVRYNAAGTRDTGFSATADLAVYWMTVQPDGKIVIGGNFNAIGGVNRFKVARLNADGSLDTSFGNPNVLSAVWSGVLQPDGKIVIGGGFDTVGGVTHQSIARLNANGTVDAGFNPSAVGSVTTIALQADGKIVIAGDFTTVSGVTRNRIARLNADGTLDVGFDPNLNARVQSTVIQADGKILVGGDFTTVGGVARKSLARLNTNGSLDTTLNIGAIDGVLVSMALQADGKIVMGGNFNSINGSIRGAFARLLNDPATQILTVSSTNRVQWLRGGTSPETHAVTFELSADGGVSWTPLGAGVRIGGGWERTGLSLPASGMIRARARTAGGFQNGSSGLVEQVQAFTLDVAPPTLSPVTISSSNPNPLFAKLGNTITLSFTANEPIQTPVVTIAGQAAAVSNPNGNDWQATLTVGIGTTQGLASISIAAIDLAGNAAAAVTATTNGSSVTVDRTPPVLSPVSITSNNANPLYAKVGNTITLSFTAIEPIQTPVVTITGPGATVTNTGGNNWRATRTVSALTAQGPVAFSITATDLAGNASAAVTATTNGSSVTVDRTPPVVTLLGVNPQTVEGATAYVEAGATATDAIAGNLTGAIQISGNVNVNMVGSYLRTYTVSDPAGNTAVATRAVNVVDTTPPTITVLGANPATIHAGLTYVDAGATASDTIAGDLTNSIGTVNHVDTNMVGTYTVTYTVSDGYNTATVARVVNVVNDAPIARVATLGAVSGSASRISVAKLRAYATDPDGDAFTIIAVSPNSGQGGTVTLLGGVITYTPPGAYTGPDSFTYTLEDDRGATSTGTVNVTVAAATAPSLNVISITGTADGFLVKFAGIPGTLYVIQYRDMLNDPWQTLTPPGPIAAGPNGLFEHEDKPSPIPPARFYRAAEAP